MFIISNYSLAVVFCFVTMICWGSWGNTQKITDKKWRFELYYWDYSLGVLLFSILLAFTLGSIGEEGRSFMDDLQQADLSNLLNCIIGGAIFNASNILLTASMALAGMAVAFPLSVGLALVLGVFINYLKEPKGDPFFLFLGVFFIVLAIICNGMAVGRADKNTYNIGLKKKGIVLALIGGVLMSFFYRFVASAMELNNLAEPMSGLLTPYTAFFMFSIGLFVSNLIFNYVIMKYPFSGSPVCLSDYFKGKITTHLVGLLGGCIWALGTAFSYIAAGKAGAAISYALGQGAPIVAAIWGIFVWKEFKNSSLITYMLLGFMFLLFISGIGLIIFSGGN